MPELLRNPPLPALLLFTCAFCFPDGKYHLLPTGELLVHNLEFTDQFPSFRCRTMHRLTRQVVVSSPANVRITGQQSSNSSPRTCRLGSLRLVSASPEL